MAFRFAGDPIAAITVALQNSQVLFSPMVWGRRMADSGKSPLSGKLVFWLTFCSGCFILKLWAVALVQVKPLMDWILRDNTGCWSTRLEKPKNPRCE
jgi:hypothetical protein